ncbi:hypothetical protein AB0I30_19010 [Nocardia tengchongensis]|uniref:hypothetical protein n=1 Tax=Nocardia tengchongensis TaxID=2055889 RepID=UPI0033E78DC7
MSRVPWSRYEGDDIEAVVSMFVCREHPGAFRIRPARGDGGVDVCVPVGPGQVEIYQVKKFAENLGTSQKSQIVKSHKRIQAYASERGWTIKQWHLTLPLEPTPGNTEWLEKLEGTADFPCVWEGLAQVEGWASAHPDIIDYYLRDGKERLTDEVARFAALSAIPMNGPLSTTPENFAGLEPTMVQHQLTTLRDTLNRRDPHFRYDIVISDQPAPMLSTGGGYPAPAASTTRKIGESCVTFHVLARGAESLQERPITVHGTLTVKTGSDEEREFEEFLTYGRVPKLPLEITNMVVNLPGGLGGEFESGMVTGQSDDSASFERCLSVLSPSGETLAEVIFTMSPPSRNHDGTGISNRGADSAQFLSVETMSTIRNGSFDMRVRFHRGDPTGHFPDKIEPSLALIHHFTAPNRMQIAPVRGRSNVIQDIPDAPRETYGARWSETLLQYVRALITIQRYADVELSVPDLEVADPGHIEEVLRTARLLDGEVVDLEWNSSLSFTFNPDVAPPEGLQQAMIPQKLQISIGEQTVRLGTVLVMFDTVEITNMTTDEAGVVKGDLVPRTDVAHLRWLGEASIDHEPPRSDD